MFGEYLSYNASYDLALEQTHVREEPTHHRDDILQQMRLSHRHTHHPILRRMHDMHVKMICPIHHARVTISPVHLHRGARKSTHNKTAGSECTSEVCPWADPTAP